MSGTEQVEKGKKVEKRSNDYYLKSAKEGAEYGFVDYRITSPPSSASGAATSPVSTSSSWSTSTAASGWA